MAAFAWSSRRNLNYAIYIFLNCVLFVRSERKGEGKQDSNNVENLADRIFLNRSERDLTVNSGVRFLLELR